MLAAVDPFEALAECSDAIVFVTDSAMRMLFASSSLARQTGFTAADFQFPQDDNPFIHREDAEDVARALATFAASDASTCTLENRFLDRWGRVHRYRTVVTKVAYRGSLALLFACRSVDVASQESADDRQYRALVESADDAIVRVDNAGRFLFANRRTHELLGYTAVQLGRLRLDDVVVAADRATLTDKLTRAVGCPAPVRCELTIATQLGTEVRFQAVFTPLGNYGHPGELLAILRPASARG